MATPEEISERLLLGYVPTYALVMVHVAVLETAWFFSVLLIAGIFAGVIFYFLEKHIGRFKHRDRWSRWHIESQRSVTPSVGIYIAFVSTGMIIAFFSSSYQGGIATAAAVFAGMFTTRELLEKRRLHKLRHGQP